MVHVSTVDTLAPGAPDRPVDEDTPLAEKTPCSYVVSKREAEEAVLEEIEHGLDAVIVNPGFMLGPWDWKPSSGRMLLEVARFFTPLAPPGGCSVCDPRDVAAAMIAAIEHGRTGARYILAGHNMTYFELWRRFAEATGGGKPIGHLGAVLRFVAGRTGDLVSKVIGRELDVNSAALGMSCLFHYYRSDRAAAELGYRLRPVDDSIRDAWAWFGEHGYRKSSGVPAAEEARRATGGA